MVAIAPAKGARAPEKGSFPLDHGAECKSHMKVRPLQCICVQGTHIETCSAETYHVARYKYCTLMHKQSGWEWNQCFGTTIIGGYCWEVAPQCEAEIDGNGQLYSQLASSTS